MNYEDIIDAMIEEAEKAGRSIDDIWRERQERERVRQASLRSSGMPVSMPR